MAAVTLWFVLRAVLGVWGGTAFAEGRRLARQGHYEEALPLLQRGAVGENRPNALWFAAQVRVGLWQEGLARGQAGEEHARLLTEAYRDYTHALSLSPPSGWYWIALGER